MQILGLFDPLVVEVKTFLLLFRLALAILWACFLDPPSLKFHDRTDISVRYLFPFHSICCCKLHCFWAPSLCVKMVLMRTFLKQTHFFYKIYWILGQLTQQGNKITSNFKNVHLKLVSTHRGASSNTSTLKYVKKLMFFESCHGILTQLCKYLPWLADSGFCIKMAWSLQFLG